MDRIDKIDELAENNIFVYENFLSQEECNKILLQLDNDLWEQSGLANLDGEENIKIHYSSERTSKTYFEENFSSELRETIAFVTEKIICKSNIRFNKKEDWQISKYGFNEKFDFHIDSGTGRSGPLGGREKTILIYLMSPMEGGETYFRALNLYIKPLQGRLVIWNNLLPNGNSNYAMIHAGLPVKKGVKIILSTWVE